MNDKRLIEETIPLEDISRESAREKSIRQGHISNLHIWWARRPLVASRAAVFGSLVIPAKISKETLKATSNIVKKKDPAIKEEDIKGKELYHFMRILCTWEASNDKEIIEHAWFLIQESHDGKTLKVLDPFAGGGSIPLEALRLGCETYSNELNPVAHIIGLCTLVYPQKFGKEVEIEVNKKQSNGQLDLGTGEKQVKKVNKLAEDVRIWGRWVLEETRKDVSNFYPIQIDGELVAYIWSKFIKCPNPKCGEMSPLIGQWWLVNKKTRKIYIKPEIKGHKVKFNIKEMGSENIDPSKGTISGSVAKCIFCNQTIEGKFIFDQILKQKYTLSPIAKVVSRKRGKEYLEIRDKDLTLINKTEITFNSTFAKNKQYYPSELLPTEGSLGITKYYSSTAQNSIPWSSIFLPRQLITLSTFIKKIHKANNLLKQIYNDDDYVKAVVTYLGIILDRVVTRSTVTCRWHNGGEKIENDIGAGKLPNVWDFVESNPIGSASGSWKNSIDYVSEVIENLSNTANKGANLYLGTATDLSLSNEIFDIIITDPPYYDSVPYSELSDFFYVWLKRSIGFLFPNVFRTPLTPKSKEIVQNPAHHLNNRLKAKEFFEEELTKSFKECYRTLTLRGIIGIMFAHKSTSAWETLINSLLRSRLLVTSSWPLNTEMGTRLRAHGSAALASSILLICRKRIGDKVGYYDELKVEVKDKIKESLDNFWMFGIKGSDFFISAIGPAIEIFGRYSRVKKLSGEEVDVTEFLTLVREEVTNYALQKILNRDVGSIDSETRFYILWRWAYDSLKVPSDDARILAQAIGAEIDDLMSRTGVLKKTGETVELLGPLDIKVTKVESIIDALHKSCQLWATGKKQELAEFLGENDKIEDENFWSTAQALSEVLPEGDKEKQLLQGLLASKSGITDTVKQTKLF